MDDYCKIHFARVRKGPGTNPCQRCGKGINKKHRLCQNSPENSKGCTGPSKENSSGWLP